MFSVKKKKLSRIKVQVTLETVKAKLKIVGVENVSKGFLKKDRHDVLKNRFYITEIELVA